MNEKYLIGVDSGSQSTKVYIFNQRGEVVVMASEGLKPMMTRQPGYVEHPDDDLWDSLRIVLKKVMSQFKGDVKDILGVGLCSIRCCRVFMKHDGTLQAPIMSWMDVRAYQTFEDDPSIGYTCSTSGYLTHRLTGQFKEMAANAYQWQFPVDMDTWDWSTDEAYASGFKIPREKLLDIQVPGTILGYVTEQAHRDTGLPIGLPVVSTANDKAVEALGAGLITPNVGLLSLGTYIASMVHGSKNIPTDTNFFTNLACVPHQYLYESGGIRRGMWLVSWYKAIIGDEYAANAKELNLSVEDRLAQEAQSVPVGSDGLMTIPDWLAPASQLWRKGLMVGFDERHGRGHLYRSILEGIALTLMNHYTAMTEELGIRPQKLIVSGGGSNSDLYMQMIADMYGVKAVRNTVNGAAALGSAICVAVATGLYPDFTAAVNAMVEEKDEFIPNPDNHAKYQAFNAVYKQLPKLMEEPLKAIHQGFNS